MEIKQAACASCGAPINIPDNINHLNCQYCGAGLTVKREGEDVATESAAQIRRSIEEAKAETDSSIRRLEIQQQLNTARLQLSDVQSEIRAIQRLGHHPQANMQLEELRGREQELIQTIQVLETKLVAEGGEVVSDQTGGRPAPVSDEVYGARDWTVGFVLCLLFGIWGGHRYYTGHIITGIIMFLTFGGFGVWWLFDLFRIGTNKFKDTDGFLLSNPQLRFGRSCASSVIVFAAISMSCLFCSGPIQAQLFNIKPDEGQLGVLDTVGIVVAFLVGLVVFGVLMVPGMVERFSRKDRQA